MTLATALAILASIGVGFLVIFLLIWAVGGWNE